MISLYNSTTGSYDTYFYKISGLKSTKKKMKTALKGYKKVTGYLGRLLINQKIKEYRK